MNKEILSHWEINRLLGNKEEPKIREWLWEIEVARREKDEMWELQESRVVNRVVLLQ